MKKSNPHTKVWIWVVCFVAVILVVSVYLFRLNESTNLPSNDELLSIFVDLDSRAQFPLTIEEWLQIKPLVSSGTKIENNEKMLISIRIELTAKSGEKVVISPCGKSNGQGCLLISSTEEIGYPDRCYSSKHVRKLAEILNKLHQEKLTANSTTNPF